MLEHYSNSNNSYKGEAAASPLLRAAAIKGGMGYARSMLGAWPLQQSRNVDGLSSLLEPQKGCQRARAEVQQAESQSRNRTPRPGVAEGHRVHEAHTATVPLQAAAAALNATPGSCAHNVKIVGASHSCRNHARTTLHLNNGHGCKP